jgi:hypothetical protein
MVHLLFDSVQRLFTHKKLSGHGKYKKYSEQETVLSNNDVAEIPATLKNNGVGSL